MAQAGPRTSRARTWVRERLVRLAEVMGLSLTPRLDEVLARFRPYVRHFAEVGALSDPRTLYLLSFGTDRGFRDALRDQLESDGFSPVVGERLEELAAHVDPWIVARVAVLGPRQGPLGVYFRHSAAIEDALSAMQRARLGVPASDVRLLAETLRTGEIDVVAAYLYGDTSEATRVYFRPGPLELDELVETVASLMRRCGVTAPWLERFFESFPDLTDELARCLLVSFCWRHGALQPHVKLDLFGLPVARLERLVAAMPCELDRIPPLAACVEAVAAGGVEHVGLAFAGNRPPSLSMYFALSRNG